MWLFSNLDWQFWQPFVLQGQPCLTAMGWVWPTPVESGTVRGLGNLFVDLQYGRAPLQAVRESNTGGCRVDTGMASGPRLQFVNTKSVK